jgi:hypothetical protein
LVGFEKLDRAGFLCARADPVGASTAFGRDDEGFAEPIYVTDRGATMPRRPAPCTNRAGVASWPTRAARFLDNAASLAALAFMLSSSSCLLPSTAWEMTATKQAMTTNNNAAANVARARRSLVRALSSSGPTTRRAPAGATDGCRCASAPRIAPGPFAGS